MGQLRHVRRQRGNQQESRRPAQARSRPGDATRPIGIDPVEIGAAGATHDPGTVNDGIRPGYQRIQRALVFEIPRQPFHARQTRRNASGPRAIKGAHMPSGAGQTRK